MADRSGCSSLREEPDGHALLDVEHVDIAAAPRWSLLLLEVPVKVEHTDPAEGLHERPAHPAKRGVVEVAVVADVSVDAGTRAVEQPLREADELHVVVLEPHLSFAERLAVDVVVARRRRPVGQPPLQEAINPRPHVRREARVGRVPDHYREALLSLDLVDCLRLVRQRRQEVERELRAVRRLQRIRQIHPRSLVALEAVAGLVELEADLEVRDGVGCHQQLVAVQARQEVPRDVLAAPGSSSRRWAFHFSTIVSWMRSMTSTRKVPVPVAGSRIGQRPDRARCLPGFPDALPSRSRSWCRGLAAR